MRMIVTEMEYLQMTSEERKNYCFWCFNHAYGDCSKCAIGMRMEKARVKIIVSTTGTSSEEKPE